MSTEYSGFQNWWRPVGENGAEYLPEYSPVRLWPEQSAPREGAVRRSLKASRVFFTWWVAPES